MDQAKIGKLIAQLRKERGMTQEGLGETLGVSQRTVSRWETGRNMPDISLLAALGDALNISVAELLAGERTDAETLTRQEADDAMTSLIALAQDRRRLRDRVFAVLAAVLTFVGMLGLYRYEFNVYPTSVGALEKAIEDYCFQGDTKPRMLRWTSYGDRTLVLYEQIGQPGAGGLATLQRGLLGRYRVIAASNFNFPIALQRVDPRRGDVVAVCSIGNVPLADAFEVCALRGDGFGDLVPAEALYRQELDGSPFLALLTLEDEPTLSPFRSIRYLDADGNEIDYTAIRQAWSQDADTSTSGYGSAELFLFYFWEGLLLLLGLVFVRYFLTRDRR